jgi:hypothetical protein
MREDRGPWYLLTGIILGLIAGALLTRWMPVEYVDTSPDMLADSYKDQYRVLIAAAFASSGNLPRAEARLGLLGDDNSASLLTVQAQQALAAGRPESEAQSLSMLAVALSQGSTAGIDLPANATPTATTAPSLTPSPSPTNTPEPSSTAEAQNAGPTVTLLPSRTPTPTTGAPFVLLGDPELVCDPELEQALLIVEVLDAAEQPVPGVEVIVTWEGGEENFFTGLKPELGLGYADFNMTPGVTYTVRTAGGGEQQEGITPAECETAAGERYYGAWRVQYVQP